MKNLVPCKICMKNFNYSPGPSGNARQFCDSCRLSVDEAELKRIEEETVIEGNRYLMDAPKRKEEYDPIDILVDGNIPEFKSDADRFICAMEMGCFIRKTGITGIEDNSAKLFEALENTHTVLLFKQLSLETMESMATDARFKKTIQQLMKLSV